MNRMPPLTLSVIQVVVDWSEKCEAQILAVGTPLSMQQISDAKLVGVRHPDKIRLHKVDNIPIPNDPIVKKVAKQLEIFPKCMAALTLRYGIFVQKGCWCDRELLLHEFAHTAQYERIGSIKKYMKRYIMELLSSGHAASRLEMEANLKAEKVLIWY